MKTIKLVIPINGKLLSTNEIYSGKNQYKRLQYKEFIVSCFNAADVDVKVMCKTCVNISYSFAVRDQRLFDTSNYSYTAKILEDCLRGKAIKDDSAEWVGDSTIRKPVKAGKYAPYVAQCIITIKERKK